MDLTGRLLTARYADYPPEFPGQTSTNAQRAGLRYEKTITKKLGLLHRTEPGPWLYYKTKGRSGVCQPDALCWLTDELLCVVEVKLSFIKTARTKLLNFYGPVVKLLHPNVSLCYLQVYRNHRKGAHKRVVSIYELETTMKPDTYRESQCLS